MILPINNDINTLNKNFRAKFDLRWKEVLAKYPNAVVFEALRTQERQDYLYAQGRTRPGKIVTWLKVSNHKFGNAVDIVFRNNGKLEWAGPYNDLIQMAKKYGIRNLAPTELCHFEDDGTPLNVQTATPVQENGKIDTPESTASGIGDVSPEDLASLFQLQKDKIRNGDLGTLDKRMLIIISRVYKSFNM